VTPDAAAIPYMIVEQLVPASLRRFEQQLPPGLILERQVAFEAVTGTLRRVTTRPSRGCSIVCPISI